jgi:hypothetical protein
MQQERGDVRDGSTQGSATAPHALSEMPQATTLNLASAGKGDVSGPADPPTVAWGEQLASRVCVRVVKPSTDGDWEEAG